MTVTVFFGLGAWRRSEDARWCREAAAGSTSELVDKIRSACTVQRERQRALFGAVWRPEGRVTARCGFELARLQLISDHDRQGFRAILESYGITDEFDPSSREHRDRFVNVCLSRG